ncbi:hypothetical protein [Cupriavidus malaysiensis]|uniref:hypothetical protein n=1 Tax=Cupriavidus malaysiensis TaxID=367825 RepID=UPI0012FF6574|nr:hypothetical protein [Cupriavidus malaysiensis]
MNARDRHARITRNNRGLLVATLIAIALVAISCLATAMDEAASAIRPTSDGRSA